MWADAAFMSHPTDDAELSTNFAEINLFFQQVFWKILDRLPYMNTGTDIYVLQMDEL